MSKTFDTPRVPRWDHQCVYQYCYANVQAGSLRRHRTVGQQSRVCHSGACARDAQSPDSLPVKTTTFKLTSGLDLIR